MSINNFPIIDNFLQFEKGSFYKFELLIRNTDGDNPLYQEGYSNSNKNILIKSWYIDSKEYYEKIKHEMVTLSNMTGARLYMTLDRKKNIKVVQNLNHVFLDLLTSYTNGTEPSIKKIHKTFASETSKKESSEHNFRTIMFDVDTKEDLLLEGVICYIRSNKQIPYILETKKGYHVVCFKKFNIDKWEQGIIQAFYETYTGNNVETLEELTHLVCTYVSLKENELGLVYHPMLNKG